MVHFKNNLVQKWKDVLRTPQHIRCFILCFTALFASFFLNNAMSTYADKMQSNRVTDFFLDLLPLTDVNFVFFWIALTWCLGLFFYHLFNPQQLTFLIWSYALFISVRACFITLTHIAPPYNLAMIPSELKVYAFEADMFFSGHVGGPFFFALLTNNIRMRNLAISYTVFTIFIVLLGHMHYSIDVFASLFIAHSLSVVVKKLRLYFNLKLFGIHE